MTKEKEKPRESLIDIRRALQELAILKIRAEVLIQQKVEAEVELNQVNTQSIQLYTILLNSISAEDVEVCGVCNNAYIRDAGHKCKVLLPDDNEPDMTYQ